MTTPERPMSRRAILKAIGATPLALLAAPGSSVGAMIAGVPVPGLHIATSDEMDALVVLAKEDDSSVDETKFRLVAATLWNYFVAGAGGHTKAKLEPGLILEAYHHGDTGSLVVTRLDQWDPNGHHPETNACAFLCGQKAAAIVETSSDSKINEDVYKMAWQWTKTDTSARFSRLASRNGGSTASGPIGLGCS